MSSDDWYRNTKWDQKIEESFFNKLKRARSQKTQYLKIQASYLAETNPDVTLSLSDYARTHCPDDFWEQEFCLYESKAFFKKGKNEEAIEKAYESINWSIKKSGTQTEIPYWLSRLILLTEREDEYMKCLELLEQLHTSSPFPETEFYFHGYSALLNKRLGKLEKARQEALTAISWASKDKNLLQNERKRKYGIFKEKNGWPYNEILKISKNKCSGSGSLDTSLAYAA